MRTLLVVAAAGAALLAVVGFLGARHHPDTSPPVGEKAEQRIAAIFGVPAGADDVLRGDYLIERFYALDAETGARYVADFCKGRVKELIGSTRPDGTGGYLILVDRTGLQQERDRLSAFVTQVAPIESETATYLGLRVPMGNSEAFPLNYGGLIPRRYAEFRLSDGRDVYDFLASQVFSDVTVNARVINIKENNYLVSNSELWPYFSGEFRIAKAVFVSRLIFLDATSPEQVQTYQQILQRVPQRTP